MIKFEEERRLEGPGLFNGFGGGGGASTTSTSTTRLDPVQRRALTSVINKSEQQYDQPLEFFPGETLADEDFYTGYGQRQALHGANAIRRTNREAGSALSDQLTVNSVDDPRTQALIEASVAPLRDQFTESVLPSISSGAQGAGAFGGTRADLMKATAGREFGRAIGETTSNIVSDAYRADLAQRGQALSLVPMMNREELLPSQVYQDVGRQRTDRAQQEIDADRERFEFEQFEPEGRLDRFASRVAGINLGGSVTGTSRQSGGGLFGK